MTGTNTIQEAKAFLRQKLNEGAPCPCCGQFVKMYRRTITSTMARLLISFYKLGGGYGWHHARDIEQQGGDFPKLAHWRLIETQENEDPAKRSSGLWRMTEHGRAFVLGNLTVKKYALIYNAKLYGFEGEKIGIRDALGEKFDYSILMNTTSTLF